MTKDDCQRCYDKLGFEWKIDKEELWWNSGYVWCRQLYKKIEIKDLDERCFYNLKPEIVVEKKRKGKK